MSTPLRLTALCLALAGASCLSSTVEQRRFYVLNGEALGAPLPQPIPGLVRVRDLDAESAYDKFQIVVRQNPFELIYREADVWAVKPGRMVSDLLARSLLDVGAFEAVTRELGEQRPDYTLSGDLHAIEVYDSDDVWYAHLAFSLSLTNFHTGETLATFSFDERKQVPTRTLAQAVRALSELLTAATRQAVGSMLTPRASGPTKPPAPTSEPGPTTIIVPEPASPTRP